MITLLITAEFTVERNRTNVTCVTKRLCSRPAAHLHQYQWWLVQQQVGQPQAHTESDQQQSVAREHELLSGLLRLLHSVGTRKTSAAMQTGLARFVCERGQSAAPGRTCDSSAVKVSKDTVLNSNKLTTSMAAWRATTTASFTEGPTLTEISTRTLLDSVSTVCLSFVRELWEAGPGLLERCRKIHEILSR